MAHSASWPASVTAFLIAIASWTTVAHAQSPVTTGNARNTLAPTVGGISGTVTNASGGAPLQNIVVQVYGSNMVLVASPSTDALGGYSVSGLAPGSYFAKTMNAGSQGFVEQLFSGKPCIGNFCSATTGTPITVTDGATTPNINFALTLGGVITGTVTAAAGGAPIQNLNLFAFTASGTFIPGTAATNASGVYTLPRMPPGNYFLLTSVQGFRDQPVLNYVDQLYSGITCPGSNCTITSGTPIVVTGGATTSGINFALQGGGIITGTITSGASADSARATVYNSSGASVAYYFYPTSSGTYSVPGLPTGNYFVVGSKFGYVNVLYSNIICPANSCGITTGTPVAVTAGSTTTNINFNLPQSGSITGTITNASGGAALAGIAAQIYNASGGLVLTTAKTTASGVYTAFGLFSATTYFVKTSNTVGFLDQLYNGVPCAPSCDVTTGVPVPVNAGATTSGINFALTASSVLFTDDPLTPGTAIKAVHITELRTRIDAVRAHYALAAYGYTHSSIAAGTSVITAIDITQMRQALLEAYNAAVRTPPTYTTTPAVGVTVVVADVADLRAAVIAIE